MHKLMHRSMCCLIVVVGLCVAGAAVADAQTVRVTAARVNVRSEPTATAATVATVTRGTILEVASRAGAWYRVWLPPDSRGTRVSGYVLASEVEPVAAGTAGARVPVAQARKPSRWTFRAFPFVEYESFLAADSFKAVFNSATGLIGGGGGEVSIGAEYFVQVRVGRLSKTGQRAFVHGGEVFPVGIEDTITLTPLDVGGGYRFAFPRRFTPYAGGGAGTVWFRETSSGAQSGEDTSRQFWSYHVMAGLEVPITKWLALAGEAQYRSVPKALGENGVSKEYGEDNLGGTSVVVKILLGRQPPRKVHPSKPSKPTSPKK